MRRLAFALVLAFTVLPGVPHAQFCPGKTPWVFSDVPQSDPFCGYITWMAQNDVTLGCGVIDATHRLFCPKAPVTRGEMSAFIARAGATTVFAQGGNAFGEPAVLGTVDAFPLSLQAQGVRVMHYVLGPLGIPNVVGGHAGNALDPRGDGQTIAGGGTARVSCFNLSTGLLDRSCENQSIGSMSAIGGGMGNTAGPLAVVGGGFSNTTTDEGATVGGGAMNWASGLYTTIAGGGRNVASGRYATVPGGVENVASGSTSFAAGARARATASGSFAWADDSTQTPFDIGAPRGWANPANTFNVRSTGGIWMVTGVDANGLPSVGVEVLPGSGTWVSYSDRNAKTAFAAVDPRHVLKRVLSLPVATWRYATESGDVRHIGPVAQDFRAAFDVGANDRTIATVDADGVALAAIQGLDAKLAEREAALRAEVREKDAAIAAMRREVDALRRAVEQLLRTAR